MRETGAVVVRAFAKINLALAIGPRRSDGYHDLVTLFQSVDLGDELSIEPADQLELLLAEGEAPAGLDNLVLRAALGLREAAGIAGRGARIVLSKRIPVGGGLGGGSSDAAAALLGLDRLWRTRLAREDLFELARGLGSDVPFFLLGGTAIGFGRGEKLLPAPELPERSVVLLHPGIAVSTPAAFTALDAARGAGPPGSSRAAGLEPSSDDRWRWPLLWDWTEGGLAGCANDFEEVVFAAHPGIGELKHRLAAAGAEHALLSGSGATVYGLFASAASAERVAAGVVAGTPGVWVRVCRTLDRGRLQRERFA